MLPRPVFLRINVCLNLPRETKCSHVKFYRLYSEDQRLLQSSKGLHALASSFIVFILRILESESANLLARFSRARLTGKMNGPSEDFSDAFDRP